MSDAGFNQSEKMLNDLEKRIHEEYEQASKEMAEKVDAYFAKFKSQDEAKREQYENGEISKKEYTEWRQRKMATGKRYTEMRDTLAKDLTNTDKIAMKMVNQSLPDVYALNMNYGTYQIEKDSKINTSFTLYNHAAVERLIKENPQLLPNPKVDIPKDFKWNQQHIQTAITQGILQGKSIPDIAKNLQRVTGMDENAAIRNARTAMTGAQNAGRMDSIKRAQARGIGVKKGWLSTLDNVTRDSHVDLDGEVVEPDKTFSNGLMYPGDPSGRPEEVYNCRCRLTTEYDKYKTDWSNMANRNTSKMGGKSYQEWKDRTKNKTKKVISKKAAATIGGALLNKYGDPISINLPVSEKLTGDRRERQVQRIENAKELLTDLSNEYDSYLATVGNTGFTKDAGHVDMFGNMNLSTYKKDTILHEFAHNLANTDRVKAELADDTEKSFLQEVKKLFTEYKKEYAKDSRITISSYSLESVDEFLAEGFTLAKAREMGIDLPDYAYDLNERKYSDAILELIDKYFKRK